MIVVDSIDSNETAVEIDTNVNNNVNAISMIPIAMNIKDNNNSMNNQKNQTKSTVGNRMLQRFLRTTNNAITKTEEFISQDLTLLSKNSNNSNIILSDNYSFPNLSNQSHSSSIDCYQGTTDSDETHIPTNSQYLAINNNELSLSNESSMTVVPSMIWNKELNQSLNTNTNVEETGAFHHFQRNFTLKVSYYHSLFLIYLNNCLGFTRIIEK